MPALGLGPLKKKKLGCSSISHSASLMLMPSTKETMLSPMSVCWFVCWTVDCLISRFLSLTAWLHKNFLTDFQKNLDRGWVAAQWEQCDANPRPSALESLLRSHEVFKFRVIQCYLVWHWLRLDWIKGDSWALVEVYALLSAIYFLSIWV